MNEKRIHDPDVNRNEIAGAPFSRELLTPLKRRRRRRRNSIREIRQRRSGDPEKYLERLLGKQPSSVLESCCWL